MIFAKNQKYRKSPAEKAHERYRRKRTAPNILSTPPAKTTSDASSSTKFSKRITNGLRGGWGANRESPSYKNHAAKGMIARPRGMPLSILPVSPRVRTTPSGPNERTIFRRADKTRNCGSRDPRIFLVAPPSRTIRITTSTWEKGREIFWTFFFFFSRKLYVLAIKHFYVFRSPNFVYENRIRPRFSTFLGRDNGATVAARRYVFLLCILVGSAKSIRPLRSGHVTRT